jgi:hypothetical protein
MSKKQLMHLKNASTCSKWSVGLTLFSILLTIVFFLVEMGFEVQDKTVGDENNELLNLLVEREKWREDNRTVLGLFWSPNRTSGERSFVLPRVTQILTRLEGMENTFTPVFIPVILNETQDIIEIERARSLGVEVFGSALGSGDMDYLSNLYFEKHPVESGILHVNCFSTAVSLKGRKNHVRIFPPDSFNPPVFVQLTKGSHLLIIYNSWGVWSSSLTESIDSLAKEEGRDVIKVDVEPQHKNAEWIKKLDASLNHTDESYDVMILSDFAIEYTAQIYNFSNLESKIPNFKFFYGDANGDMPIESLEILDFIQRHNGSVLQPFTGERNRRLTELVNSLLNEPKHLASPLIYLFSSVLDIMLSLDKVPSKLRWEKRRFADTVVDENGDNASALYEIFSYSGLTTQKIEKIVYISDRGEIFIGLPPS